MLNRSNARQEVFHKEADYAAFLNLMEARESGRRCAARLVFGSPPPCPYGSESWQHATAARLGLEASLHPRGRPRKPEIR